MGSASSCKSVNKFSASRETLLYQKYHNNPLTNDFTDNLITEDLIIIILSFVPIKDLIFNCSLTCKHWKYLINSQTLWRLKCEREKLKLPSHKLSQLPDNYYRNIYAHYMSTKKNLIQNPCGEYKFQGWKTLENAEFCIENPPVCCDPLPIEVGSQSCFTTAYFPSQKYQLIELLKDPINQFLLHYDLVNIKIGEWFAVRFDSAAVYELQVILYDKNYEKIDSFEFWFVEKLWAGGQWHLITHVFDKVTEACYIHFQHKSERVFGCGHHGCKITGAFVELCIKCTLIISDNVFCDSMYFASSSKEFFECSCKWNQE